MNRIALALGAILSFSTACSSSSQSSQGPASQPAPSAQPASASAGLGSKTIVEVAVSAGSFNTLVTALKAANLVSTLQGAGPFTVFAPNDAAFAKLPAGTLESLLADKDKLTAVLTYHVVSGKVMAKDVLGLSSADTLNGASLPIDTSSGVSVGEATVISTDIEASNGVIHVIDTVLIPPSSY